MSSDLDHMCTHKSQVQTKAKANNTITIFHIYWTHFIKHSQCCEKKVSDLLLLGWPTIVFLVDVYESLVFPEQFPKELPTVQ